MSSAIATPEPAPARQRVGLAVKFALAFLGLVSLVLVVNGAVNLLLSYDEAKRAALTVQQEKADAAAQRINQFVSEIESQIGWTTRTEWQRIGVEQQRYDFIRLLRQTPAITDLQFLDGSGKEQLRVSRLEPDVIGSLKDYSADPPFAKAIADHIWFGPVYFRNGSEPYMTIAIAHAGHDSGVTVAEVNLEFIGEVITAIRVGGAGYAFIVTQEGRLIAHPDMSLVLRNTDWSQQPQVAPALSEAKPDGGGNTAAIVRDYDGKSVLSAYAPIARLGWIVFVALPASEALAPVYRSLIQTGALLGLGLVLAGVGGTLLARRLVVPIRRLQLGAERLGEGDLAQRIEIKTGDEIETLADRFNLMASRIQESHETLEAKVDGRTRELARSLEDLRNAQDRLIQSEKLASLGQLTAGIAHEIKNPLNFVNNFAELSRELLDELGEAVGANRAGRDDGASSEIASLTAMIKSNLDKVVQHGRRADSIVKNMLLHSRQGGGERRSVDLNAVVEESLNLAYHGARAEKPDFNITLAKDLDPAVAAVDIYPQEFTRVLLNLISNGFYATHRKKLDGGGAAFAPTLAVSTKAFPDRVEIRIRDNGTGLSEAVKEKMFNPFFTTKPAGEGTGLGLSLSHDIVVKQHGGRIDVESKLGEFTQFTIALPRGTPQPAVAGAGS
jgi:two-component system NtrC family sensor kinase